MRLHELEVTAFGPFSDTVTVDFDDLSSAGLFLLSGPTGSGKTSILDAVCFALYGDVPGDRSSAKRLRCDTAAPGVAPRVHLDATVAGRRFRFTRSPAWSRPKRRGTGSTTQHASVLVEERLNGEWVSQSTRLDEAGHLVTGLIGMNMAQFCQVAMLPQGRFQTFLRAKSEERHALLQQLFSTQRFQDIERWLRDHTRGLHRRSQELQREATRVVSRVLEVTGEGLPQGWSADDLSCQMLNAELTAWVQSLASAAAEQYEKAIEAMGVAERFEQSAREQREAGHRLAELKERGTRAHEELRLLGEAESQHRARQDRLARARRVAPFLPLHRLAISTAQHHDRVHGQSVSARARVEEFLGLHETSRDDLTLLLRNFNSATVLATRSLPHEAELTTLRGRIAAATRQIVDLEAAEAQSLRLTATLPSQLEERRSELVQARSAAAEAERLGGKITGLDTRLAAHARAEQLRIRIEQASEQRRIAVDECQSLKEHWLMLTEARIRGMAAEIAAELAVGSCCPVCGSAEHPAKAEPAAGAPTAATEKDARTDLDNAEVVRTALDLKVHELSATLAQVSQEAGDEAVADLQQRRNDLESARSIVAATGRTAAAVDEAVTTAERALQSASAGLAHTRVTLAETRVRLENDRVAREQIERDLSDLLEGSEHATLAELIAHHSRAAELCETALRLDGEADATARQATEACASRDEWLIEHDVTALADALDAVLTESEEHDLERDIFRHQTRLAAATAVLDDPTVAAALGAPAPDLGRLDEQSDRLRRELSAAGTHTQVSLTRSNRLSALYDELDGSLNVWRPVHASYAVASELASFVEGKSTENELRMRLSAYVLAWRLTQVVAAANERLVRMTGQRYTLEHTGRRGAGESRGGLSLMVLDEWSGEFRDPATLSGGETFVVSLALALGLADVVTQEAGGAELDTLFVDEGFGSLDSETLDDVMDTLDSLRDGGRVVGVVSHVGEMRSRIPAQLGVSKDRTGSTVTITRSPS